MVLGNAEQLAHELGALAKVLLDELRADDAQERRRRRVSNGLGEQRLARARLAVEDCARVASVSDRRRQTPAASALTDALGRLDTNVLVQLGVRQRELDGLLHLLDLL